MRRSISDLAIILSRTDYGEKDRILTVLTPNHGKLKAIAKSVRSSKSRLAGGIELFAENELGLVEGRGELYTVTSSRMKRYFGDIAKDIDKSMYVYECLKMISKLAPDGAGGDYYASLAKLFEALNTGKVPYAQIKIWYGLKLLENLGVSPNFETDPAGRQLPEKGSFQYDFDRHCFFEKPGAPYGSAHIKIFRHLLKAPKPVEIKGISEDLARSTESLIGILAKRQQN